MALSCHANGMMVGKYPLLWCHSHVLKEWKTCLRCKPFKGVNKADPSHSLLVSRSTSPVVGICPPSADHKTQRVNMYFCLSQTSLTVTQWLSSPMVSCLYAPCVLNQTNCGRQWKKTPQYVSLGPTEACLSAALSHPLIKSTMCSVHHTVCWSIL